MLFLGFWNLLEKSWNFVLNWEGLLKSQEILKLEQKVMDLVACMTIKGSWIFAIWSWKNHGIFVPKISWQPCTVWAIWYILTKLENNDGVILCTHYFINFFWLCVSFCSSFWFQFCGNFLSHCSCLWQSLQDINTINTCTYIVKLRGNVGENQRGAPTCRHNLCSYSGYQKYS